MNWVSPLRGFTGRNRLRVIAAVTIGALVAVGAAGAALSRSAVAPSNSSAPSIGGDIRVGGTATANAGTWAGSTPITFQYQWLICGPNGNACHDISGATAQNYQVKSDDAGNTLRVRVIAGNADGSNTATSAASAKVGAAAPSGPANSSLPTISGDASVNSTLTADPGTWTGGTPITFTYQWAICDGNGNGCHDISGANTQTYQVTSADPGNTVRVRVTAANSGGSSSATSGPSAKIGTAPAATGCPKPPSGATSVSVTDVTSPARLQIGQFALTTGPITGGFSSFSVRFVVTDTCGTPVNGALVYATAVPFNQVSIPAEGTTDTAGSATLTFNRRAGFPASRSQQLMVLFVRARKPGDPLLAGISTRRLISLRVNLHA
jgi:hypothetical protein